VLREVSNPDEAAADLIELAIHGGGHDNITCIVADVIPAEVPATA
jgi:protein phosphatase